MSLTPIRMKNKQLSQVHLDPSGAMVIKARKATSDSASKGVSAQPAGPLTEQENLGNPGPLPSTVAVMTDEPSTGAPAERVAPETKLEADKQPAMKPLEQAPSQVHELPLDEEGLPLEQKEPSAGPPPPAPHEKVPAATANSVLKTETAADAELKMTPSPGPSESVGKKEF